MISYVHPNYVRRPDEVTAEQLPGRPVPGGAEARLGAGERAPERLPLG
nr:MAG TPA: hypothetical protein [Caudoviricetes sp.]